MSDRIGDIFLRKKLINHEQLEKALQEQVNTGEFLGEILIRSGYAKEEDVLRTLAEQSKTQFVRLAEVRINPAIAKLVPRSLAVEHKIMPIDIRGEVLLVAMSNPLDIWPLSQMQDQLSLADTQFVIASKKDIENHIQKYYGA